MTTQLNLLNKQRDSNPLEMVRYYLLQAPLVQDCAVLKVKNKLIAYVVANSNISSQWHSYLKDLLPREFLPSAYILISNLPLTETGEIDNIALIKLPVLDNELVKHWETELQKNPAVDRVAVVVQDSKIADNPLHLDDLLPEVRTQKLEEKNSPHSPIAQSPHKPLVTHNKKDSLTNGGELPKESDVPTTLTEMLVKTAAITLGEKIVHLQTDGTEIKQSYGDLLQEAEQILAGLRKQGLKPQDKVILQLNKTQDIIASFWGCILGGFIPVIMEVPPSYREESNGLNKLCNVWQLLEQPLIITRGTLLGEISQLQQKLDNPIAAAIETLQDNQPDKEYYPAKPDEPAFFNLTSGSTGMPKCISLTHRNLIDRARGTNLLCDHSSEDIILNWLPFDHIGSISDWHVRCVYLGCQLVYVAKEYVLSRPLNWLDLIHRYRISHSWAPNFAYALVNDALKQESNPQWDLSCVQSLLTAGEAVSSTAVRDFIGNLKAYGFKNNAIRPAFGMAEMGSGITYFRCLGDEIPTVHTVTKSSLSGTIERVAPNSPDSSTFADLGGVILGVQIRIVDSDNNLLPEDTIGRLQVKGNAVFHGYYKNPEVNKEVFTSDGWFNTGDLGFVTEGNLVVTGRAKETIIINGANFYNHEIESVVETVSGVEVSYTAACAVRDRDSVTDKLAIFFCLTPPFVRGGSALGGFPDLKRLPWVEGDHSSMNNELLLQLKAIRQAVVSKVGANPDYIIPVEKTDIPKTAIGKIQRSRLSKDFEAGKFSKTLKKLDILSQNENTIPNWFYKPVWRSYTAIVESKEESEVTSLIFLSENGSGKGLSSENTILVRSATEFTRLESNLFALDYTNPEHYHKLFSYLKEEDVTLNRVLHLGSYGNKEEGLEKYLDWGLYSLLYLVQALAEFNATESAIKLLVISDRLQAVYPEDALDPGKAPLMGLVKAVSAELPWLSCRHLDLDGALDKELIERELRVIQSQPEVAYRNGIRLIPRLEKVFNFLQKSGKGERNAFTQGGMYLITGGFGGIGTKLARYLLETYQARLILVGRTLLEDNAEKQEVYKALQQLPGKVSYQAIDITDLELLKATVSNLESQWESQLQGVIHLAGNAPERSLLQETKETLSATLNPKIQGTQALHQLIATKPEGIFISFSSLASFFGGAGIAGYSGANRFLESFTHDQNQQSQVKSYCLAWSIWDGIGISQQSQAQELLKAKGYRAISWQKGLNSLLSCLASGKKSAMIGLEGYNPKIQQEREPEILPRQTLVGYFTSKEETVTLDSAIATKQLPEMPLTPEGEIDRAYLATTGRIEKSDRYKPENETEKQLIDLWKDILNLESIGVNDSFFELGGTSIQAARLFAEIEQIFAQNLPLATLFNSPTVQEISKILTQEEKTVDWSCLVPIKPEGSKPPLFCVHGMYGNILIYYQLAKYLDDDQPVYGLQAKGLDGKSSVQNSFPEMAAAYIKEMQAVQPEGAYHLAGLSNGGVLALEMAQQLAKQGKGVAFVGMFDSYHPDYLELLPPIPRFISLLPFVLRHTLPRFCLKLIQLGPDVIWKTISQRREKTKQIKQEATKRAYSQTPTQPTKPPKTSVKATFQQKLNNLTLFILQSSPWAYLTEQFVLIDAAGSSLESGLKKVRAANQSALQNYQPQDYPGKITILRASIQPPGFVFHPYLGWDKIQTKEIETHAIQGFHEQISRSPELAEKLQQCLDFLSNE